MANMTMFESMWGPSIKLDYSLSNSGIRWLHTSTAPSPFKIQPPFTFLMAWDYPSAGLYYDVNGLMMTCNHTAVGSSQKYGWFFSFDDNTGSYVIENFDSSGTGNMFSVLTYWYPTIAVRVKSFATGGVRFFYEGLDAGSVSEGINTSNPTSYSSTLVSAMGRQMWTDTVKWYSRPTDGYAALWAFWSRALPDAEMSLVTADPFAMLRPRKRVAGKAPTAAAARTVSLGGVTLKSATRIVLAG